MSIGLADQLRLYEERFDREVDRLAHALQNEAYVNHLRDLGRERLIEGYKDYGDLMYTWPAHLRSANMDEEVADFIVYGTSEP